MLYIEDLNFPLKIFDYKVLEDGTLQVIRVLTRRHGANLRNLGSLTLNYSGRFLGGGLRVDFRGKMISVESDEDPAISEMLCGGTVNASIVHSWKVDPNNPYVKRIIVTGIRKTYRLRKRGPDSRPIPWDVLVWIKNEANNHHGGGRYSPLEFLEDIPRSLESWEHEKSVKKIKSTSCPSSGEFRYDKLKEKFILRGFKQFGSNWSSWKSGQAFLTGTSKAGIFDEFKECEEANTDMLHEFFSQDNTNDTVLANYRLVWDACINPHGWYRNYCRRLCAR